MQAAIQDTFISLWICRGYNTISKKKKILRYYSYSTKNVIHIVPKTWKFCVKMTNKITH